MVVALTQKGKAMAYGRGHEKGTRKQAASKTTWWYQTEEAQELLRKLDEESTQAQAQHRDDAKAAA